MGIRHSLIALAPPWLSDDRKAEGKFLYVVGLMGDALLDKAEQALLARMPELADPSALPLLGEDRLIPAGPSETTAQYAKRLRGAFPMWQRAGINSGVLRQVLGFLDAFKPRARIVSDTSIWCSARPGVDAQEPYSYQDGSGNWNWGNEGDPHPPSQNAWWRWWLLLYSTTASGNNWAGTPAVCGDGTKCGDPAKACGVGIPNGVFRTIRQLVGQSKRAGSWCRWIAISFDDSLFRPDRPGDDAINPAGGWGKWGKQTGNVYGRARPLKSSYCDGWASTGATAYANFPTY